MDVVITGAVVASAVAYLVWRAWPKRKPAGCAGCPVKH
ncbi:MAG TPA: FeoB-associated Cys-rich membrane protein [Planctomycetota bacterium]|nr:FeoB-associated Cys-rich membrane protein [Planctomycetota bacterium]